MNVAPQAVFQTLKAMCAGQKIAETFGSAESSAASQSTSITTAPTEPKGRYLQQVQSFVLVVSTNSWSNNLDGCIGWWPICHIPTKPNAK